MSSIISNSGKGKELSRRRTKPPREELGRGVNLCEYCTAKCCRYFTFPLEKPTTRQEFDALRWSLLHEHATAFTEAVLRDAGGGRRALPGADVGGYSSRGVVAGGGRGDGVHVGEGQG